MARFYSLSWSLAVASTQLRRLAPSSDLHVFVQKTNVIDQWDTPRSLKVTLVRSTPHANPKAAHKTSDAGRNTAKSDNTLQCRVLTVPLYCTHVLKLNVISGAVVNKRSTRSRWMAQLFFSSVGHRPRSPHASATQCASSLPALGLHEKSCFVLVLFWMPPNLLARYHLHRRPGYLLLTHNAFFFFFCCVRQQTCCQMAPASCPDSLVLSTKGVRLRSAPWSTRWCLYCACLLV